MDFIMARLKGYAVDAGFKPEWFEAVRAVGVANPLDFWKRLEAVDIFTTLAEAEALSAANKRISNLLKKTEEGFVSAVNPVSLTEQVEKDLWFALCEAEVRSQSLYEKRHYGEVLAELASLKEPIDAFFNGVMVNAEDESVRRNRLALLATASQLFGLVADIGQL
jgi:glycyl-tRNA synthetase beta chain